MRLTARCFDRLNMTSGGTPTPDLEFCMILFSHQSEFGCCKNLQKQHIKLQFQQNTEK